MKKETLMVFGNFPKDATLYCVLCTLIKVSIGQRSIGTPTNRANCS